MKPMNSSSPTVGSYPNCTEAMIEKAAELFHAKETASGNTATVGLIKFDYKGATLNQTDTDLNAAFDKKEVTKIETKPSELDLKTSMKKLIKNEIYFLRAGQNEKAIWGTLYYDNNKNSWMLYADEGRQFQITQADGSLTTFAQEEFINPMDTTRTWGDQPGNYSVQIVPVNQRTLTNAANYLYDQKLHGHAVAVNNYNTANPSTANNQPLPIPGLTKELKADTSMPPKNSPSERFLRFLDTTKSQAEESNTPFFNLLVADQSGIPPLQLIPSIIGFLRNPSSTSQNVQFFLGVLEQDHRYIQWLFPTQNVGQNPNAPYGFTDAEIKALKQNPNVIKALNNHFALMLMFYGLKFENGKVSPQDIAGPFSFTSRGKNWIEDNKHNHLRLTRMVESLRLFGLTKQGDALVNYLADLANSTPHFKATFLVKGAKTTTAEHWNNLRNPSAKPPAIVPAGEYIVADTQKFNSCMLNSVAVGVYLVNNPNAVQTLVTTDVASRKNTHPAQAIQQLITDSDNAFNAIRQTNPANTGTGLVLEDTQKVFREEIKAQEVKTFLDNNNLKDTSVDLEMKSTAGLSDAVAFIQGTIALALSKSGGLVRVNSLLKTHATVFGHTGDTYWEFNAVGAKLTVFANEQEAINAIIAIYNSDQTSNAAAQGKETEFTIIKTTPKLQVKPPLPQAPTSKSEAVKLEGEIQSMLKTYQIADDKKLIQEEETKFNNKTKDATEARKWLKEQITARIDELSKTKAATSKQLQDYKTIQKSISTGSALDLTKLEDTAAREKVKQIRFAAQVTNDPTSENRLSTEAKDVVTKSAGKDIVIFTLKTNITNPKKPKELIKIDDPKGVMGGNKGLMDKLNDRTTNKPIEFEINKVKYTVEGAIQNAGTPEEYVAFVMVNSATTPPTKKFIEDKEINDYAAEHAVDKDNASLTEFIMEAAKTLVPKGAYVHTQSVETATFKSAYRKGP